MITLTQQQQLLIGSAEDIAALQNKDHARILVVSDSHNHFDILLNILRQFGPSCDGFIFCGDGLGDIATVVGLAEKKEEIRAILPPVIAFVSGNCDPQSYPLPNEKSITAPTKQILTVNGQNIFITHGHKYGINYGFEKMGYEMQLKNCKTGIFGHTHIAEEVYENDFKFINPGSCVSPRGGQPAGFAILTVEKTFVDAAFIKAGDFSLWQPN